MLYELDSKLMTLERTLQSVMVQLSYFRHENNLIDNMQMHINRIYTVDLDPSVPDSCSGIPIHPDVELWMCQWLVGGSG